MSLLETTEPSGCAHAEVLPIPGNEDWGRCAACGADDFPLTAKAAYGDVECSACNDTGLVPVDLTGQAVTHRDGTTSIAGPGHFADAACPACGEGCRVELRVPAAPRSQKYGGFKVKAHSAVCLFVLSLMGASACGETADDGVSYSSQEWAVSPCSGSMPPPSCNESDTGGGTDAGTGSGGTWGTASPLVAEPLFNGGFDERLMGRCVVQADDSLICFDKCYTQPDGSVGCDWPTWIPYGWWMPAPRTLRDWGNGIHDLYGSGRTYSPPHPNHPTHSSNSALSVLPCLVDVYDYNHRNCSLPMSLVSPRFAVTAGASYRLSYWFRATKFMTSSPGPTPVGLRVNVHWYFADGTWLSLTSHDATPDVTPPASVPVMDWVETGRQVVAPPGATYGAVEIMMQALDRHLYVDDVRLIP